MRYYDIIYSDYFIDKLCKDTVSDISENDYSDAEDGYASYSNDSKELEVHHQDRIW